MAHLGPTMGGGSKYPHRSSPPPIRSSEHPPEPHSALVRLPMVAVRPPASPNRRLSAVYRSDGAVSRPATRSIRSPPRTSGLPTRTHGKPRLGRGKPPRRRYVSRPLIYLVSKYVWYRSVEHFDLGCRYDLTQVFTWFRFVNVDM
jgi:hypothetical protein